MHVKCVLFYLRASEREVSKMWHALLTVPVIYSIHPLPHPVMDDGCIDRYIFMYTIWPGVSAPGCEACGEEEGFP